MDARLERLLTLVQDLVDCRAELCRALARVSVDDGILYDPPTPTVAVCSSQPGLPQVQWDLACFLDHLRQYEDHGVLLPSSTQDWLVGALQDSLRNYQIDLKDPVMAAHFKLFDLLLQPEDLSAMERLTELSEVVDKLDQGLDALGLRRLPRTSIDPDCCLKSNSRDGLRFAGAISELWKSVARLESHVLALDHTGCVNQ